jgi:hypothetical protein
MPVEVVAAIPRPRPSAGCTRDRSARSATNLNRRAEILRMTLLECRPLTRGESANLGHERRRDRRPACSDLRRQVLRALMRHRSLSRIRSSAPAICSYSGMNPAHAGEARKFWLYAASLARSAAWCLNISMMSPDVTGRSSSVGREPPDDFGRVSTLFALAFARKAPTVMSSRL